MWNNLIIYENLWYSAYSIYLLLLQNQDYLEIYSKLNTLYKTNFETNIIIRYIYLYILDYLIPKYTIYIYIIHLPPIYNIYIEPILSKIAIKIYNIIYILGKCILVYIFCITIRIHPNTTTINSRNLYINLNNIYNSDLYECVYHCCMINTLSFWRNYNYSNYKFMKYIYYYRYNYNFTITPLINTHEYFNKIITLGYYQNVINTPDFAYNFLLLFSLTMNYIMILIYLYNVLNCTNLLVELYSNNWLIKWCITCLILAIIDYKKEEWKTHLLRFMFGIIYPNGIISLLLINKETLECATIIWNKYRNIYISTHPTETIDFDENFWN